MSPELRPATAKDIAAFYGKPPRETVRAIVAELNGEPVGIAGIAHKNGCLVLFCDLKPEMRKFRKSIVKAGRQLMSMTKGRTVRSVADPNIPGSGRFLEAIGLKRVGPSRHGEVFESCN